MLAAYGASFSQSRIALLRGEYIKDPSETVAPFGHESQNGRLLLLSSFHLDPSSIDWYVDELDRFRPDFIWAYPSVLSSLVRLVSSSGLTLHVPLVVTSSEVLAPAERRMASDVLGATIVDYYGQAERVALASDFDGGYRFDPLYSTVELISTTDSAATDGLAVAKIIGTSHWNPAMPLVRYDLGDSLLYRPDGTENQLERIATGEETFVAVQGRNNQVLISPEGRTLTGIDHLPRALDGVVRMQVRQPAIDRVEILVIPDGVFSEADQATLDASIAAKIPPSMRVEVQQVDELPRTDAGKTPFVVRAPGIEMV